jgi:ketosteroid isomerase-like protein
MKRLLIVFGMLMVFGLAASSVFGADESNMKAMAAAWEKEYNADNLAAIAAMYASDGCRMPPNAEAVHGTEAIIGQLKKGKEMGMAKIKIAVTMSETMGDSGHAMGTFEITGADGSHKDHGKWMNVTKKVDGVWKIQCDIFNSSMPMPAMK